MKLKMKNLLLNHFNIICLRNRSITTGIQNRNKWIYDWKPGPYPKTKEEREAAAQKYGLIPEDYEPYPDDGMGLGDYPKLPEVSAYRRDNFHNWDHVRFKRDYGEPIHRNFDIFHEERLDINCSTERKTPVYKSALQLVALVIVFVGMNLISKKYAFFHPWMPKQWPYQGEIHYTFETADK